MVATAAEQGCLDLERPDEYGAQLGPLLLDPPARVTREERPPGEVGCDVRRDTANRSEADGLGGVENFRHEMRDLKVDVFGPVSVATFVFDYGFDVDGESMDLSARTTMVFVDDGGVWRIGHEHLSPFKANP